MTTSWIEVTQLRGTFDDNRGLSGISNGRITELGKANYYFKPIEGIRVDIDMRLTVEDKIFSISNVKKYGSYTQLILDEI
jgi:hypothetical protein